MLNLLEVRPGQRLILLNGAGGTVTENVGDGIWLKVRFDDGAQELVFCEDIARLDTSTETAGHAD